MQEICNQRNILKERGPRFLAKDTALLRVTLYVSWLDSVNSLSVWSVLVIVEVS